MKCRTFLEFWVLFGGKTIFKNVFFGLRIGITHTRDKPVFGRMLDQEVLLTLISK